MSILNSFLFADFETDLTFQSYKLLAFFLLTYQIYFDYLIQCILKLFNYNCLLYFYIPYPALASQCISNQLCF